MIPDFDMDCCFTKEKQWFRYRAAAIIIEDQCVLMAGNEKSDYYYSIGGGVHLGETAEKCVLREVEEETGVRYEIDRLVFLHENFFTGNGWTEGYHCHEIAFYFLMKSRGNKEVHCNSVCAQGKESVYWVPLAELKNNKVFPAFFVDKLVSLPERTEHIVSRNL